MTLERWKEIPGTLGLYEASTHGRVRRVGKGTLKVYQNNTGYFYVKLSVDGSARQCRVHRLVLETFVGPGDGLQTRHLNGNKSNNTLENLAWGTARENCADKKEHGTLKGAYRGEKNHNAKLSDADVERIAEALSDGVEQDRLAAMYGVHQSTISRVRTRSRWRADAA